MTMKFWAARVTYVVVTMMFLGLLGTAHADDRGEGPLNPAQPPAPLTPEVIIQKFAAKEAQFKAARESYTWRQDVRVQTLDGSTVDGEYRQVIDILFDDRGKRVENVVFAPQSSLQRISMSREDFDDIEKRLPFVLTTEEIPEYDILYVGQQKEDELNTYVFDIAPKKMEKNKRYFQGRIWVDNQDFQIVKTKGKNVPDIVTKSNENLFPPFTTWREQIDGKYWFPTYTYTDDTLHFKEQDVHIRQIVKYTNYKRFGSSVKITYEGQDIDPNKSGEGQQQPQQGNPPPAAPPPSNPKK